MNPSGPNHALQRTAPCLTAPASTATFPRILQLPRHTLRVVELEVDRRCYVSPVNENRTVQSSATRHQCPPAHRIIRQRRYVSASVAHSTHSCSQSCALSWQARSGTALSVFAQNLIRAAISYCARMVARSLSAIGLARFRPSGRAVQVLHSQRSSLCAASPFASVHCYPQTPMTTAATPNKTGLASTGGARSRAERQG